MDNSLGKHVACVAACLAATVALVSSPAHVRADKNDSQAVDSTVRLTQHAEMLPAVSVPAAEMEGMIQIPAGQVPAEIPFSGLPVEQGAIGTGIGEGAIASDVVDGYDDAMVLAPGWYAGEPAPVFSTGSWFSAGRWYTQFDTVVLTRDGRSERRIAVDFSSPSNRFGEFESTLTTQKEKFDYQLGTRATIGRFLGRDAANRDHLWEFAFLGGFDWRAQSQIVAEGAIQTTLTVTDEFPAVSLVTTDQLGNRILTAPFPGFNDNDVQTYRYDSDFNSAEFNYRIKTRPGRDQMALHPSGAWTRHESSGQIRSFLAGARAMSVNEAFLNEAWDGDPLTGTLTGVYRVRTNNALFGPQVGVEAIELNDRWHVGFRGYAGMLANFADRRSFLDVPASTDFPRAQKLSENRLAFFSQVGLYGALHLRPNLSVRAGYDFMYMSGLGIAIDNLFIGDEFPGFSTNGVALYHGLSVGFEQTW